MKPPFHIRLAYGFEWAFIVALIAHGVYDATHNQILTQQYRLYEVITVLALAAVVCRLPQLRAHRRLGMIFLVWSLLNLFFIFSGVLTSEWPPPRVFFIRVNYVLLFLPALLLLAGWESRLLFSARTIQILTVAGSAAAVIALICLHHKPRFDPPSCVALAGVWCWAVMSRYPLGWRLLPPIVLLALAFQAGQRTFVILWIVAGVLALFWTAKRTVAIGFGITATIVLMGLIYSGLVDTLQVTTGSSFNPLAEGKADVSLTARLDEMRDAWDEMEKHGYARWIFGGGHGALYEAHHAKSSHNIIEGSKLHHIHFGPMLMLFRYGLIGVVLFVTLAWSVAVMLKKMLCHPNATLAEIFFPLTMTLYLLSFMMRNVMEHPLFAWTLAGFLRLLLCNNSSTVTHDAKQGNLG